MPKIVDLPEDNVLEPSDVLPFYSANDGLTKKVNPSGLAAAIVDDPAFTGAYEPKGTHIADTVDAHDASAISILDAAGNYTATDVEGALAELPSQYLAHR